MLFLFFKGVHPSVYQEYQSYLSSAPAPKRQKRIPFPVVAVTSTEKQRTHRLIQDYIINGMRPLSTVEEESFKKLVQGN